MAYDHILTEKEDGVAIITLNRPEVLNAMNRQLSNELHDAVTIANNDDEVGCIVLTGSGSRAFSAGGDIHEQRENDKRIQDGDLTQEELDAASALRSRGGYELSASPKPLSLIHI